MKHLVAPELLCSVLVHSKHTDFGLCRFVFLPVMFSAFHFHKHTYHMGKDAHVSEQAAESNSITPQCPPLNENTDRIDHLIVAFQL